MYSQRRRETSFDNGIIYPVIDMTIKILFYLNIIEWIKKLSDIFTKLYFKDKPERIQQLKIRRNKNLVIDLFIILKFYFILLIIFKNIDSPVIITLVWYLLCSNVFTYFYYHLWCEDALLERYPTVHRVRRRFISLFLSLIFMIVCFIYFYVIFTPGYFSLKNSHDNEILISSINALAKSFAIDYEGMTPKNHYGVILEVTQTINMFIFVSILLAKSIPKANQ